MRLLISKWPPAMTLLVHGPLAPYLGHVCVPGDPGNRQILTTGWPLAMLAAGEGPGAKAKLRALVSDLKLYRDRLLFLAPPIFPLDHDLTLASFYRWRAELRACGPVAYVALPHTGGYALPWNDFEGLVLHGSRPWLHSTAALDLARLAKFHRKHLHVACIDTLELLRLAHLMKADSVSLAGPLAGRTAAITMYAQYVRNLVTEASREGPPVGPG